MKRSRLARKSKYYQEYKGLMIPMEPKYKPSQIILYRVANIYAAGIIQYQEFDQTDKQWVYSVDIEDRRPWVEEKNIIKKLHASR